ncbi:MAG: hypothetical protein ABSG86_13685 [Thermoguttaceae bacterium]|jgi:hypothetical protein
MTNRALAAVGLLVIAPLVIATWILATYTIGQSLNPNDSALIGFGIALLAMALLAYLVFFSQAAESPGSYLGVVLVICGTLCVLGALALQFYLTSVTAEHSRQLAEILGERLKTNPSVNLHLSEDHPQTAGPVAYLTLLAGIWLAAVGIKLGVVRQEPVRVSAERAPQTSPSPADVARQ